MLVVVRLSCRVAVMATACIVAMPAWSAPPVAPEPVVVDHEVSPTALSQPLPLERDPSSPKAVPIRPLPDWRLLVALGGAFAAVAAYRLVSARRSVGLPTDVFEVLGEATLGGQQSVRVLRFGPRTLLVGVSSAGLQTLAEVTDAEATDAIAAACRSDRRGTASPRPRPAASAPRRPEVVA